MKTSTALALLLTGSVILNAYLFMQAPSEPLPCCPPIKGFEAPSVIVEKADVIRYVEEYKASIKDPEEITGGIITREAFDEMLCLKDCDAIAYTFARDESGSVGPGKRGVFLILSGVKTVDGTSGITGSNIDSKYYYTRHWCPPSCIPL